MNRLIIRPASRRRPATAAGRDMRQPELPLFRQDRIPALPRRSKPAADRRALVKIDDDRIPF